MICKNKECQKEFEQIRSNQNFCEKTCYNRFWTVHAKNKQQHKIEELSREIERLKKTLGRKNSKANQP